MRSPSERPKTRAQLILNDQCPECQQELDTGWECLSCGFDARPEALALPAPLSHNRPTPADRVQ